MTAVHKKHTEHKAEESKHEEPKKEIVVSDVVTEMTERIEVIEGVTPQETKLKKKAPIESAPAEDPLIEFKEKMTEEEYPASDISQKKNYMWPILLIFIIAILLLVGVFLYKNEINTNDKINVVTLSPSPTIVPEPTKTIDLAKYEIEILNGGGVSGEASRQKTNLAAEGFKISSIGNADNSDYIDTIIKAKKEVDKDFIVKLKSVLSNSFAVGEAESLSEDASVPIVIILGTKK